MKKYLRSFILLYFISSNSFSQNLYISGGNTFSTLICADGGVLSFGKNDVGQFGSGVNSAYSSTPVSVSGNIKFKQVDAGSGSHAVALACDNSVWAWGQDSTGQLGNGLSGTGVYSNVPVQVLKGETNSTTAFLENATYVSGGNDQSFAILNTGEVVAWGLNDNGQLGNGTIINSLTPVYVLTSSGIRLTDIIAIEGGDRNGIALDKNGNVWTWGFNDNSQLGRTNAASSNYAGKVIKQNGTFLTGIVQISAGDKHGLAIDLNGNVWSWGGDWGPGQLGQTSGYDTQNYAALVSGVGGTGTLNNVVSIAAGQAHSIAVLSNGRVVTWGANGFYNCGTNCTTPAGQLGIGTTINGAAGGAQEFPQYVLTSAGVNLTNIKSVSDGDAWSFAVSNDNKIYVWGYNAQGQLGLGHTNPVAYATELVLPGTCILTEPCPQANLGADIVTCSSFSKQLYAGSEGTYYHYQWYRNGTPTGVGDTLKNYTATNLGTYFVVIRDNRPRTLCSPCPSVSDTIVISEEITPFTRNHAIYCPETGDITFSVSGSGTFNWFTSITGGSSLGSGTTITVPKDNAKITSVNPTIYELYVQDISTFTSTAGLPLTAPLGGIGNRGVANETYVVFNALTSFTLDSITIKPYVYSCPTTLTFNFQVLNAADVSVGTSSYTITLSGASCTVGQPSSNLTIPIKILIPVGNNYKLRLNTGSNDIAWYQTGAVYPITTSGILNITGPHPAMSWVPSSIPGFFNWKIVAGSPYACGRAPVRMTGCAAVEPSSECSNLVIPNIYTPNNDQWNQTFVIQGNCPNSHLEIYNRWGKKMYKNENYKNDWDGLECADGIYYYIYKRPKDEKAWRGWVEIIR